MAPIMSGDLPGTNAGDSPLHKAVADFYKARGGQHIDPGAWKMAPDSSFGLRYPLGHPSITHTDNSRGDVTLNHSPTFHVSGGDVKQNLEASRLMASRGTQDLLRNMQGAEA